MRRDLFPKPIERYIVTKAEVGPLMPERLRVGIVVEEGERERDADV